MLCVPRDDGLLGLCVHDFDTCRHMCGVYSRSEPSLGWLGHTILQSITLMNTCEVRLPREHMPHVHIVLHD